MQEKGPTMDKVGNVVLDIESLAQEPDRCSGRPEMTKALSRKGSSRIERHNAEEQETDETSKKLVVKVCSEVELLKQPLLPNKALIAASTAANSNVLADAGEGRGKRFRRLTTIHPRQILLLYATMSSVGTLILIYCTLAINTRAGALAVF